MNVAIVKYNAGNTASVANALRRLGVQPVITDDPETLRQADKVIFPGVGEASTAMAHLRERQLDSVIRSLTRPVLGICLGMQLLCTHSEENDANCLGMIPNRVRRFAGTGLKVPHIGWNSVESFSGPLFEGVAEGSYVYFVHGYYVNDGGSTTAKCSYGVRFSAAVSFANFHAVQFHPEKSGAVGEKILGNFVKL